MVKFEEIDQKSGDRTNIVKTDFILMFFYKTAPIGPWIPSPTTCLKTSVFCEGVFLFEMHSPAQKAAVFKHVVGIGNQGPIGAFKRKKNFIKLLTELTKIGPIF